MIVLTLLIAMVIFFAYKRPGYDVLLFTLITSLVSVYAIHINSLYTGSLFFKVQNDIAIKDSYDFAKRIRNDYERWRECGCMDCINSCVGNSNP